ncbi:hypothetical protein [Emcibacter nanhaiensis]|uniref:Uncharacterized protein n=1 Tax=Emcibacter nanhaiensis TaxID=1505037 RepID=A0A501PA49_9PROT|nr:hypothetical protein [Emcibacter nanhaiensis]TPD57249.1 hypothetical protein FIV46_14055 [Emcibacter nanhaiensis]
MWRLALAVSFIVVAGCSRTVVHLNDQFLDEQEIKELVRSFEDSGFAVVRRQNHYPETIYRNTLIYFPSGGSEKALAKIQAILLGKGYGTFDLAYASRGNHSYTKSNVGVYILPKSGQVPHEDQNLLDIPSREPFVPSLSDSELVSRECKGVAILDMLSGGQFQLDSMSEPPSFPPEKGRWQQVGEDGVILSTKEAKVLFNLRRTVLDRDDFRQHQVILEPRKEGGAPLGCRFSFSVREYKQWRTSDERHGN